MLDDLPNKSEPARRQLGFSLVEMLVVISIIGLLVGLTFTALSGVDSSEVILRSRNNLRQIHTWMEHYSNSHRDRIVPSQFDYFNENGVEVGGIASGTGYSGSNAGLEWVPSNNLLNPGGDPREGFISQGTWADILWVETNLGDDVGLADFPLVQPGGGMGSGEVITISYRYRAPDRHIYDYDDGFSRHPLRSMAPNSYNFPRHGSSGSEIQVDYTQIGSTGAGGALGLPKPFGSGAWEKGLPGFFAANNFFDARSKRDMDPDDDDLPSIDRYVTHGQINAPNQSMYLVDSFAGLTIGGNSTNERATAEAFLVQDYDSVAVLGGNQDSVMQSGDATQEVDLRYAAGEACLMLFLDGHVDLIDRFSSLGALQGIPGGTPGRGIRVLDLDRRKSEYNP